MELKKRDDGDKVNLETDEEEKEEGKRLKLEMIMSYEVVM